VLEGGRIVERGTHESLYAFAGRYYDLYTKQHGVETNLFLAPGESPGESLDANGAEPEGQQAANGEATGSGQAATLPEAIRLIRGRET
jgi:hypothetical protein